MWGKCTRPVDACVPIIQNKHWDQCKFQEFAGSNGKTGGRWSVGTYALLIDQILGNKCAEKKLPVTSSRSVVSLQELKNSGSSEGVLTPPWGVFHL